MNVDRILSNLSPLTIYAIAFISIIGIAFQIRWSRRGVALGPTLLTTLGIFFCFVGIALGLTDFDPNNVKSSVPHLLQGIRTSFWVSVCGIGWALTIKIRSAVFGEAAMAPSGQSHNATIDDLVNHLARIHDAIAAATPSSMVGHLQQLHVALQTHAQRAAEENSKALLQALSTVVREFNTTLNEQFGQNFHELNIAAGRLADWQIKHAQALDLSIDTDQRNAAAMAESARQFAALVEKSSVFAETAQSLSSLMEALNAQREQLAANLQQLAGLIDGASVGIPRMSAAIIEMTEQIAQGVRNNQEALGAAFKASWQSVQVHNQHLAAMLKKSLEAADHEAKTHASAMAG